MVQKRGAKKNDVDDVAHLLCGHEKIVYSLRKSQGAMHVGGKLERTGVAFLGEETREKWYGNAGEGFWAVCKRCEGATPDDQSCQVAVEWDIR